jgi:hypothetical protein
MPTDLQLMYARERIRGAGHHAALRELSAQTTIDKGTLERCLRRARHADERDERARRKESK